MVPSWDVSEKDPYVTGPGKRLESGGQAWHGSERFFKHWGHLLHLKEDFVNINIPGSSQGDGNFNITEYVDFLIICMKNF